MQVLCVASDEAEAAIACPVCGQQYEVFYARSVAGECEAALELVKKTLMEHHREGGHRTAHPGLAFNVPAWHGEPYASGAALLGGATRKQPVAAVESVSLATGEPMAKPVAG